MKSNYLFFLCNCLFLAGCGTTTQPDHDPNIETPHIAIPAPTRLNYQIIRELPHDTSAYTQGLEMHEGVLYEGTGDYELSSLRTVNPKTGIPTKKQLMGSKEIFGEGVTVFKDKIYQLTWQNHTVYVYDKKDFSKPIKSFNWPYEGWGLTHDSSQLIISDGSANLYFVDPETFQLKNTISVKDDQGPVNMLNELEYVDGQVYANVYQSNFIVKIDVQTGWVKGKLSFNNLLKPTDIVENRTDVLNGIAYLPETKTFLITGKRWPKMFEISIQ